MNGLEPYTGYEEYDPSTGYSAQPGDMYDSANKTNVSSDKEKESSPVVTAYTLDPGRICEINLLGEGFILSEKYSAPHTSGRGEIPLIAFFPDSRRKSIHPLAVIAKPPGFNETFWTKLDADRLFVRSYDSTTVPEEILPYAQPVDAELPQATQGGGSGGRGGAVAVEEEEEEHDPSEMPFLDHLEEFRWALLKSIFAITIGMVMSWFLSEEFISTITSLSKSAGLQLVYNTITEPIMIRLQTALYMGIVISFPFIFYFIWSFVSPGLYRREKKWILPILFSGAISFFIGALIAYFIVIPFMLKFIKQYMIEGIIDMLSIGDFISKMLKFTVLFGVIFEVPLVSYILAKIGILKHTWMSRYRKYAIVSIFIAAAIFTPPDPLSQIILAIPLIVLYEIGIQAARIGGRKTLL